MIRIDSNIKLENIEEVKSFIENIEKETMEDRLKLYLESNLNKTTLETLLVINLDSIVDTIDYIKKEKYLRLDFLDYSRIDLNSLVDYILSNLEASINFILDTLILEGGNYLSKDYFIERIVLFYLANLDLVEIKEDIKKYTDKKERYLRRVSNKEEDIKELIEKIYNTKKEDLTINIDNLYLELGKGKYYLERYKTRIENFNSILKELEDLKTNIELLLREVL